MSLWNRWRQRQSKAGEEPPPPEIVEVHKKSERLMLSQQFEALGIPYSAVQEIEEKLKIKITPYQFKDWLDKLKRDLEYEAFEINPSPTEFLGLLVDCLQANQIREKHLLPAYSLFEWTVFKQAEKSLRAAGQEPTAESIEEESYRLINEAKYRKVRWLCLAEAKWHLRKERTLPVNAVLDDDDEAVVSRAKNIWDDYWQKENGKRAKGTPKNKKT